MTLRQSIEANIRNAASAIREARRIAHEARNVRQRVWGDRFLRAVRREQRLVVLRTTIGAPLT